jgi:hypothetical protein
MFDRAVVNAGPLVALALYSGPRKLDNVLR